MNADSLRLHTILYALRGQSWGKGEKLVELGKKAHTGSGIGVVLLSSYNNCIIDNLVNHGV